MSSPTPEQVWAELQGFVEAHAVRKRLRERLGTAMGTGGGKVKLLLLLESSALSHGEVAEALGVDRPYTTVLVNALEEQGLVERRTDSDDRRRKLVALTEQGRRTVSDAREVIDTPPAALDRLSPAELTSLSKILAKLHG
ncbi:MarR family protein [Motilibacter rhizosphaerae]|uniref:MarR family protein n=1 Tax=Motilibacter rhizosphaerae TaxID=598652 RepID=A0A4Q7NVN6_9ACTN|nr:MarR family transcriptional regulator [Motilibacter rhizosphaerae]RZS91040.1 MarR family protein [Motilibacter rhizosphaerae]